MTYQRDPIEEAFEPLRSREWNADQHKFQLEDKLMQHFNSQRRASGSRATRALVIGLCVVLAGGAAVAATGGLSKWWVRISVNGEVAEVPLDQNGEAEFTMDTSDGSAAVYVKRSDDGTGEQRTEVRVQRTVGEDQMEIEGERVVRHCMEGSPSLDVPLEDVIDGVLLAEWHDSGVDNQLYLAGQDHPALFLVSTVNDEVMVRKLAVLPPHFLTDEILPEVTIGDDGMITLSFEDGEGREAVMKFMVRQGPIAEELDGELHIGTPTGEIQVELQQQPD